MVAGGTADVDETEAYIAKRSRPAARRVVEKIWEAARKQCHFPYSGRTIPELQDPTRREIFIYEYRLMYRVEGNRVRVLHVVHGRRVLRNVPGSFEESPQVEYSAA